MVKKLFKHEFYAYARLMLPMYAVMLGIALLGRLVQFFESTSGMYYAAFIPTIILVVLSLVTASILSTVFIVIRFYRHLFTGEGYLSFTLPVSPAQHINVKLFTALLFQLLLMLVTCLSVTVLLAGDMLTEVIKVIDYLWPYVSKVLGAHLPLYIVELIAVWLLSTMAQILLFYACIALGQMFNKSRVLAAIGIYFGYVVVSNIITTIINTVITPAFDNVTAYIESNALEAVHISFLSSGVMSALLGVVCYVIVHTVMRKKLNLE